MLSIFRYPKNSPSMYQGYHLIGDKDGCEKIISKVKFKQDISKYQLEKSDREIFSEKLKKNYFDSLTIDISNDFKDLGFEEKFPYLTIKMPSDLVNSFLNSLEELSKGEEDFGVCDSKDEDCIFFWKHS